MAWTMPTRGTERGDALRFVQTDSTVTVDLAVTRYREFPEDGILELWGYVGDYEVCVHLPLDDDRARHILGRRQSPSRSRALLSGETGPSLCPEA
jgi:hypothetical protein